MVTASHNPPQDNGYKVYLGDGAQIVPPPDARDRRGDRGGRADRAMSARPTAGTVLGDEVARRYLDRVARLAHPDGPRDLRTVVHPAARRRRRRRCAGAARRRASPRRTSSRSRSEPDPEFPTVAFPNPEEPGAMDLAHGARRARAAPTWCSPTTPTPTAAPWRCPAPARLAHAARRRGRRAARRTTCSAPRRARATYALLDRVVAAAAARSRRPTGRRTRDADRLQVDRAASTGLRVRLRGGARLLRRPRAGARQGRRLGAAAASRMAAPLKAAGRTLLDLLDDIALEHGLHATDQLSVRVERPGRDRRTRWTRLRATPPTELGGPRRRHGRGPRRGRRRPAADRRPALPARRRRPGHRAARRAPSPSSSATSRSSSRSPGTAGSTAARVIRGRPARGPCDAIKAAARRLEQPG